jgi:hypothetical protein
MISPETDKTPDYIIEPPDMDTEPPNTFGPPPKYPRLDDAVEDAMLDALVKEEGTSRWIPIQTKNTRLSRLLARRAYHLGRNRYREAHSRIQCRIRRTGLWIRAVLKHRPLQ